MIDVGLDDFVMSAVIAFHLPLSSAWELTMGLYVKGWEIWRKANVPEEKLKPFTIKDLKKLEKTIWLKQAK